MGKIIKGKEARAKIDIFLGFLVYLFLESGLVCENAEYWSDILSFKDFIIGKTPPRLHLLQYFFSFF